jgi:hypothetical protein
VSRPKRSKKPQQATSSADADAALESIPEDGAPARPAPRRPAAVKPADSDDETMDRGLSLMDRLAGQCALCGLHLFMLVSHESNRDENSGLAWI